jgi:1-pyrroline-5-carboxylate dehydrogenase
LEERTSSVDAVTQVPMPVNEPVKAYEPQSAERDRLEVKLKELAADDEERIAALVKKAVS